MEQLCLSAAERSSLADSREAFRQLANTYRRAALLEPEPSKQNPIADRAFLPLKGGEAARIILSMGVVAATAIGAFFVITK